MNPIADSYIDDNNMFFHYVSEALSLLPEHELNNALSCLIFVSILKFCS